MFTALLFADPHVTGGYSLSARADFHLIYGFDLKKGV